ncbi:chemotaxis protein CheW [Sphingomonas yunnanensis]|uniref:chemotaxis protein CheW n=1 Tax=Sphingomonas yunnanensis TaxID=310400 RepID=UPI001CA6C387|nr:chemotaxis protein CheW [Sphingomonas yunnanensis]MBY9062043.1 chemotaxis protein CheW [Sphingomonas yunnanensis]
MSGAGATLSGPLQTIVFGIADELFALPVGVVREILDHRPGFRIPAAPDWLIGLCDVRGESVPMVDFRRCLGLDPVGPTPATRVIVVEAETGATRPLAIGLIVDRVADVCGWSRAAVEPVPDTGTAWRSCHVVGVLRRDAGLVGLLDLAGILAGMEQALDARVPRRADLAA